MQGAGVVYDVTGLQKGPGVPPAFSPQFIILQNERYLYQRRQTGGFWAARGQTEVFNVPTVSSRKEPGSRGGGGVGCLGCDRVNSEMSRTNKHSDGGTFRRVAFAAQWRSLFAQGGWEVGVQMYTPCFSKNYFRFSAPHHSHRSVRPQTQAYGRPRLVEWTDDLAT